MLFIDARNYFTVVDRTLNEWSDWQLKNMNAIVWLYRGETDKYQQLMEEYHSVLGEGDFEDILHAHEDCVKELRSEAKASADFVAKKDKKRIQAEFDEKISEQEEQLMIAREAVWLYSKFGDGEYQDIPGLCKIAYITEENKPEDDDTISIEGKGWSLTPGAYVGVAPIEDDGVNFYERIGEIHEELLILQEESNQLMETISQNMKEMGL